MSKKKETQQLLPWSNEELENLLQEVISHGTELPKLDFKLEVETSTPEAKAELLKDVIAIANTYDDHHDDYGFLVYGVKSKAIVGTSQTEADTDKFQNTLEQILKTYISPMLQVYVFGFETEDGKKWGAIVIPPRNSKPYMFFKDLNCGTDRSRSRKKGDWFIRRGSTTDHGTPEDLTRINQKQMEVVLEPLRESIRSLQLRVTKTEEQYNSALFQLVERALKSLPEAQISKEQQDEIESDIEDALGVDLPTRLKKRLRTPKDALAEDLIAEAKAIRDYLEGADTGLPWTPQLSDPEENKKIIEEMEEKINSFILSVSTIVLNDSKNTYTEALLRALKLLAKSIEVPSGTQYNRIGEALRYYPLYLLLYTIFVCGVAANRGDLLKKVLQVPLKHHRSPVTSAISDVYFYTYEAKQFFNHAYGQRWCEPLSQRVRQFISDRIGEVITDSSEPEYFFKGEFVLALTNIDKSMNDGQEANDRMPLGGLYLYLHESHEPILEFIRENNEWFSKLYSHPLNEILDAFDRNAHRMTGPGCHANMYGLKTVDVYEEAKKKKPAS